MVSRTPSCFQRLIRFTFSRARRLERAGEASGQMTVLIDVARAVGSDPPPGQVLASRTGVMILLGVGNEPRLETEKAASAPAGANGRRRAEVDGRRRWAENPGQIHRELAAPPRPGEG